MKLSRYISLTLSLLTLTLVAGSANAFPPTHEINEDYHIRVVIPEESADKLSLTYPINGEELTVPIQHGEIVSLSITDGMLDQLNIPFVTNKEEDQYIIHFGDPDPMNSLNPVIGFHSTLEAAGIVKEPTLVITAPDAKVEVVFSPGEPQEIFAPDDTWPMLIDESFKNFNMDGVLDIKFYVKPAAAQDEGDAGDEGQGDEGDKDLQDDLTDGPASGGCSLVAATGSSGSIAGLFLLSLVGLFSLRRKIK